MIRPSESSSDIWGWRPKQAFYSVQVADELPQFRIEDDPTCKWQIGFVYRPGPNSPFYDEFLGVLRNFEMEQNRRIPGWGFVVPRGHLLVNEWEWKFLHFIKRYKSFSKLQIANDLCTLILGTIQKIEDIVERGAKPGLRPDGGGRKLPTVAI